MRSYKETKSGHRTDPVTPTIRINRLSCTTFAPVSLLNCNTWNNIVTPSDPGADPIVGEWNPSGTSMTRFWIRSNRRRSTLRRWEEAVPDRWLWPRRLLRCATLWIAGRGFSSCSRFEGTPNLGQCRGTRRCVGGWWWSWWRWRAVDFATMRKKGVALELASPMEMRVAMVEPRVVVNFARFVAVEFETWSL